MSKNTYIDIDNEYVHHVVKGEKIATASSEAFLEELYGTNLGMLPPAVRWISDAPPFTILLERPPQALKVVREGSKEVEVPLGWTLWLISIKHDGTAEVAGFARSEQLYTFDEPVAHLPLPGFDENGHLVGFSHALNHTQAIGYQLPDIIESACKFAANVETDELNFMPDDWPTSTTKLFEHWSELTTQVMLTTNYQQLKDVTVADLTLNATSDDAGVFDWMVEIINRCKDDS